MAKHHEIDQITANRIKVFFFHLRSRNQCGHGIFKHGDLVRVFFFFTNTNRGMATGLFPPDLVRKLNTHTRSVRRDLVCFFVLLPLIFPHSQLCCR